MNELCSLGNLAKNCCVGDPWEVLRKMGNNGIGFRIFGEPLFPEVIATAKLYEIDPHDLDWHVEAIHGWEPHDTGYKLQVESAAECMLDSSYQEMRDKDRCRFS